MIYCICLWLHGGGWLISVFDVFFFISVDPFTCAFVIWNAFLLLLFHFSCNTLIFSPFSIIIKGTSWVSDCVLDDTNKDIPQITVTDHLVDEMMN